jgi:hypothetical protein
MSSLEQDFYDFISVKDIDYTMPVSINVSWDIYDLYVDCYLDYNSDLVVAINLFKNLWEISSVSLEFTNKVTELITGNINNSYEYVLHRNRLSRFLDSNDIKHRI